MGEVFTISGYGNVKKLSSEKKHFNENIYDTITVYEADGARITQTKRLLDNGDYFLYYEIKAPKEGVFILNTEKIVKTHTFDDLYLHPPFDNRYGENDATGPSMYGELKKGGALVISKVYYYTRVTQNYKNGDASELLELSCEQDSITVCENTLEIKLQNYAHECSFFMLCSKEKLFETTENLYTYFECYYRGLFNSNVVNSYFVLPSGTMTKLPYSIEPFTKKGYGYSLHHSSKKELIAHAELQRDRYFYDMLYNAIIQTYLYQKHENHIFYTPYTSTWLKKQSGIYAPYIDTRLNEVFYLMILDFRKMYPHVNIDIGLYNYLDFLVDFSQKNGAMYRSAHGVFFPDYFKPNDQSLLSHTSLNHQLGIMHLLRNAMKETPNSTYIELYQNMVTFLLETADSWIKEDGDIYYSIKKTQNGFEYFDKDYVYVTLIDLLHIQSYYKEDHACISIEIDKLINSKMSYLDKNNYGLFDKHAKLAPGESNQSQAYAAKLYSNVYGG